MVAIGPGGVLAGTTRRRFLVRCAWFAAGGEVFLVLVGLLVLIATHPYLPLAGLLGGLPDIALLSAPVVLPAAALAAFAGALGDAERHQVLLALRLAGRPAGACIVPLLLPATVIAVLLYLLQSFVLPHASFRLRAEMAALSAPNQSLVLRLARRPRVLTGLTADVAVADEGGIADLVLTTRDDTSSSAIVASGASLTRSTADALCLRLERGRVLRADRAGALVMNLAFDELDLQLGSRDAVGPRKQEILALSHYTDRELAQLPAQVAYLVGTGREVDPDRRQRARTAGAFAAVRWQTAALPLWFAVLALAALRGGGRAARARFLGVSALLLAAQTGLELLAGKRGLSAPALLPWLPAIAAALCTVTMVVAGRRAHARV